MRVHQGSELYAGPTRVTTDIKSFHEQHTIKIRIIKTFIFIPCPVMSFFPVTYFYPMLSGSLVNTAWRVLRLRLEEKVSRYGGQLRIY
jgi:hypothetical protein